MRTGARSAVGKRFRFTTSTSPPGGEDASLHFYRDILGFDVVTDADMGEGAFLTFAADDVGATVEELRARGATTSDVTREPWGTFATVDAPDGHKLQFNERPRN